MPNGSSEPDRAPPPTVTLPSPSSRIGERLLPVSDNLGQKINHLAAEVWTLAVDHATSAIARSWLMLLRRSGL